MNLTPEQQRECEVFLSELAQITEEFLRKHKLSRLISIHATPDSSWLSIEHEERNNQIVRIPPACHITLVKL